MNTQQPQCRGFKPAKSKFNKGKRKLRHALSEEQIAWIRRVYPLEINKFV